jgi:hypothetical protein
MHALWLLALPLLACRLAGAQESAREAGTPKEPLVAVATRGATTRAPTKQEIEDLALTVMVRARGQVVTEIVADGPLARAGLGCGDVLVKLDAAAAADSVRVIVRRPHAYEFQREHEQAPIPGFALLDADGKYMGGVGLAKDAAARSVELLRK